jgi:hypothetical protein
MRPYLDGGVNEKRVVNVDDHMKGVENIAE